MSSVSSLSTQKYAGLVAYVRVLGFVPSLLSCLGGLVVRAPALLAGTVDRRLESCSRQLGSSAARLFKILSLPCFKYCFYYCTFKTREDLSIFLFTGLLCSSLVQLLVAGLSSSWLAAAECT